MNQNQQYQKVKLYRILKVVFYMLGLPLFMVAVCFTTVKFLGHDPFMGDTVTTTALGFFMQIESYVTAPALYGVWIAFALWAVISIVHIVLNKTVKSRRVKMFAVVATCLIVMLLTGFVMDAVFEAQIEQIAIDAKKAYGSGVTVADYKTQLSYYRTLSSNAASKSETTKLIEQVDLMKKVYNVGMEGQDKGGVAGNISNKPVTYGYVISDEKDGVVSVGVDIGFKVDPTTGFPTLDVSDDDNHNISGGDGVIDAVERDQVIELAPVDGKLVINGVVYSNYWYKEKGYKTVQYNEKKGKWETISGSKENGQLVYVWYSKDLMPTGTVYVDEKGKELPEGAAGGTVSKIATTDGVYGTGTYNRNGLMSDGWVFSLDNVLNILADYYDGKAIMDDDENASEIKMIIDAAVAARESYYLYEADERTKAYYEQELYFGDRFSITQGRLDYLVAQVGALLGNNALFDFLLGREDGEYGVVEIIDGLEIEIELGDGTKQALGQYLAPFLENLEEGWSLKDMLKKDDAGFEEIAGYIRAATGLSSSYELKDAYLVVSYKGEVFGEKKDNLYVALIAAGPDGKMGTDPKKASEGGSVLLDIDFSNELIGSDNGNDDYAFDLDHLSQFLNTALDGLLDKFGVNLYNIIIENAIGSSIAGLLIKDIEVDGEVFKGLEISGIQIPLFKVATRIVDGNEKSYLKPAIDISAILVNVLKGLYSYQSPLIKPFWEFIQTEGSEVGAGVQKYYRAQYEAETYGKMIGSILIGDTLGAGTYPSALGLADINAVRQLQVDLSYKPTMYPLFSLRDMIMFFTGLVVFFYFLSFVCSEKEYEYATGTAVAEERKKRNKKKGKNARNIDEIATEEAQENVNSDAISEDAALPQDENTQKEVE